MREDNSRTMPGIRDVITRHKVQKQKNKKKRLLTDTLANLYTKFTSENSISLSFTTFWRLKPFWVVKPTLSDRETCLCKTCENIQYMANSLFQKGVLETKRLETLMERIVCNPKFKCCMYRECELCKTKSLDSNDVDKEAPVTWQTWKSKTEERNIKGKKNCYGYS